MVSALPLQCITGAGVMQHGLAKGNLLKPARQSGARLQDTERVGCWPAAHAILWLFPGAELLSLARGDRTLCVGQPALLPGSPDLLAGGQGIPDGPHDSHSLKNKKMKQRRAR